MHRADAARLMRLGVESAPAGSVLHAVGEEGVAIRDVAAAIGQGLELPVASIGDEQAGTHFGFLAGFLGLNIPASSTLTRELLSWAPTGPGLIADPNRATTTPPRQPERPPFQAKADREIPVVVLEPGYAERPCSSTRPNALGAGQGARLDGHRTVP